MFVNVNGIILLQCFDTSCIILLCQSSLIFHDPKVIGAALLHIFVARDFQGLSRPMLPVLSPPMQLKPEGEACGCGWLAWSADPTISRPQKETLKLEIVINLKV